MFQSLMRSTLWSPELASLVRSRILISSLNHSFEQCDGGLHVTNMKTGLGFCGTVLAVNWTPSMGLYLPPKCKYPVAVFYWNLIINMMSSKLRFYSWKAALSPSRWLENVPNGVDYSPAVIPLSHIAPIKCHSWRRTKNQLLYIDACLCLDASKVLSCHNHIEWIARRSSEI